MRFRKLILMVVIFLFILSNVATTMVSSEGKQIIKVGYPILQDSTDKDNDGNFFGYTVDYLEEIRKYTGWEYEFVEVEGTTDEQVTKLLDMLEHGEIDLMGSMIFNDFTSEIYDYPSYFYGLTYITLAVRNDDSRWLENSPINWSGITVGVYPGMIYRVQEFIKYAELNGFSYELIEYDSYAEIMDALKDGSVDATLQVDISTEPELKNIAKFTPSPYYFATTKGNTEIVSKLNYALSNINSAKPYFQTDLSKKYFSPSKQFVISKENKKYIKSLGTINVLMIDGNAPIQYDDGEIKGISISYLEALKEATGLQYHIIVAEDYDECKEIMEKQHIDLMIGVPTSSDLIKEFDLTLSLPYLENPSIKVWNSSNNVAIEEEQISNNEIYNTSSVLNQINQDKNTVAYLDSYIVNFYTQQLRQFKHVKMQTSKVDTIQYAFGLVDKDKSTLLSIINNYINSVSSEELYKMISDNLVVQADYTIHDFVTAYYLQIITFVLLLILLVLIFYIKIKLNHHKELALQNRRFNELSKLTNVCIFEYDYVQDVLKVQNKHVILDNHEQIHHFMKCEQYDFLKEMIKAKQNDSRDFLLQVQHESRWFRVKLKVIRDQNNKACHVLGKIYDVNDKILKHNALLERSRRDALTNLLNRKTAEECITTMLEHDPTLGIMILIDMDNFKAINDNLGHLTGDKLLQE